MKIRKDRPLNKNGNRHFKNALEIIITPNRTRELKEYISSIGLKFQHDCRFSFVAFSHQTAQAAGFYDEKNSSPRPAIISFKNARDLMLFKLAWTECEPLAVFDSASFYCPYVPLTHTSVSLNSATGYPGPATQGKTGLLSYPQFKTRYNLPPLPSRTTE